MEKLKLNIQLFGATTTLTASETAIDDTAIQNNQTYINLAIRVRTTAPTWNGEKSAYYQVTTKSQNNGTQKGSKYYFSIGSSSGSGDKTFNVKLGPFTHNADGSLDDVEISVYTRITSSTTHTTTKDVSMATIPRASQPTISENPTLGNLITISTNRVSEQFTHTLRYTFGNISEIIATDITESTTWTPPITLAQQITTSTTGIGTIYCDTYQDGALIGTKSVSFTATVPSSIIPTIQNVTLEEAGDTPSEWGVYVKSKSKIKVTISASGNQGSTITNYNSNVANSSYIYNGTSNEFITNFLAKVGTYNIETKVKDTRERTSATNTTTYTCVDYNNPSIAVAEAKRTNTQGIEDDQGTRIKYTFNASISPASNKNTPNYKLSYREIGEEEWITADEWGGTAGSDYVLTETAIIDNQGADFDPTKEYEFKFEAWDHFTEENHTAITQRIETGFDLMNFNPSGKSMAIGRVSTRDENEECLDVALETTFEQTVHANIDGNSATATTAETAEEANKTTGTATFKQNGTTIAEFNGSENKEIEIPSIPTKSIITLYANTAQSISGSALNKVHFQEHVSVGTGLTRSNHEVVIGTGITKVLVSGQIYIQAGLSSGNRVNIDIYKNHNGTETQISTSQVICGGSLASVVQSPILIDVSAGDKIILYARNRTSSSGSIYYIGTNLTVEEK